MRVRLRKARPADQAAFLEAANRSRSFHQRWGYPPATPAAYRAYLARLKKPQHIGWLIVLRKSDEIVGAVHVTEMLRGDFRSAYVGYYLFAPYEGNGYMTEGLTLALRH